MCSFLSRLPFDMSYSTPSHVIVQVVLAYSFFGLTINENNDLMLYFTEYDKFEKPMIRNDDSDMIVVKDSPGTVVFELNENGDFPRITIE